MNERYIRALVKLTRVANADLLNATIDHILYGETQSGSANKHGVKQEAVARLAKRIIGLDRQVSDIIKLKNNT
ncbi:hypothetical protein A1QO_02485 [Vibrio genomosp. F10 str. ZF-129]|uniref:Uncharacterized protein n=1 Tax=Vibrio genomosp. F10 str. ZF-129 TaxID=1187848 RepID=A0A1E5BK78_9VIBR|nr:hypothetical protein [Vibrio genomosp. F10]OEE38264.1 hypothetical protein A1QO_02485 [Vibrio genomosp. F10 str. ZF-129]